MNTSYSNELECPQIIEQRKDFRNGASFNSLITCRVFYYLYIREERSSCVMLLSDYLTSAKQNEEKNNNICIINYSSYL
jgi:hypothetical protein